MQKQGMSQLQNVSLWSQRGLSHPATICATSVPEFSTKAWAIPRSHTWRENSLQHFLVERKSLPGVGPLPDLAIFPRDSIWEKIFNIALIKLSMLVSWWQTWRRVETNGHRPHNKLLTVQPGVHKHISQSYVQISVGGWVDTNITISHSYVWISGGG